MDLFITLHGLRYYQSRDAFIAVTKKHKSLESTYFFFDLVFFGCSIAAWAAAIIAIGILCGDALT